MGKLTTWLRWSLVSAVALGEVGWHVGRRVSGDSAECEGARRQSEGGNVGCGSVNPRDPPSERVKNSGGPGRVGGNMLGEGNGLKRQRLALLGANTRAHRAFFATPCRNCRRPPHRSLEYLYPRDVPTRHALTLRPLTPMSHSPAPPPQISNNTNNNGNTHSSTSPAQLAHILSTVLADNETLSKELAVARARYERAEQTLALLKPPHTSVTAASDAPSPPYPEPAVRTIMDLQSQDAAMRKRAEDVFQYKLSTYQAAAVVVRMVYPDPTCDTDSPLHAVLCPCRSRIPTSSLL
jgi:hypothetical protein